MSQYNNDSSLCHLQLPPCNATRLCFHPYSGHTKSLFLQLLHGAVDPCQLDICRNWMVLVWTVDTMIDLLLINNQPHTHHACTLFISEKIQLPWDLIKSSSIEMSMLGLLDIPFSLLLLIPPHQCCKCSYHPPPATNTIIHLLTTGSLHQHGTSTHQPTYLCTLMTKPPKLHVE